MILNGHKKTLLLVAKIVLAVLLLLWVLSKVYLQDYVVDKGGASYSIVQAVSNDEDSQRLRVSRGWLWWREQLVLPITALVPISNVDGMDSDAGMQRYIRAGFLSSIRQVRLVFLLLAAFGLLVPTLMGSVRWWYLLRIQGIRIRWWEVLRLTFLGLFFNSLMLGAFGGDLVKAYYATKHGTRKGAVLLSVVLDRFLGLATSAAIAAVMIGILLAGQLGGSGEISWAATTVGVVLLIMLIAVLFLFSVRFRRILCVERIYTRLPFAHHVASAARAVKTYRDSPGGMLKAMGLALVAQLFAIGSVALIGCSLSLAVPWYCYFAYVPVICIIGAVPLTPGGIGVVENLYVVFFTAVSPSSVLALALLARLLPLLWSLPGLIVAVTGPRLPKAETMRATLNAEGRAA